MDRAALDAALELGLLCGGWCPLGRLAEDGTIDPRYPLTETPGKQYIQRTRWNIRDSDGTLVLNRGELSGGTLETVRYAEQSGKPVLVIDIDEPFATGSFVNWCRAHKIVTLNVAGPRESKAPGVYARSLALLRSLVPATDSP